MASFAASFPALRTGAVAVGALLLLSCDAPDARSPEISVANGWTREAAPGQAAAVYLTIANHGDGQDRLVDVRTPAAALATLHSSSSSGGVARMRRIENGVEVPARSNFVLKPGGTHIMLTGLKQPLSAGQSVDVSLGFARSGRRSIAIRVVPVTAGNEHLHRISM